MNWLCKLGLHSWDFDGLNKRTFVAFGQLHTQYLFGHKERCRRKKCRRVRKVEAVIS